MSTPLKNLVYSAMCLALALVLPFLTGQIPEIGSALAPMHIPALLCGFICGPVWGLAVGAIAPLLRHLLFSMPPLMAAIPMAFELAVYGLLAGLIYRLLPKKLPYIYVSLIAAMTGGRIVWGIVRYAIMAATGSPFTFGMFIAGAFTDALPGIICQLLLIPLVVSALKRAGVIQD